MANTLSLKQEPVRTNVTLVNVLGIRNLRLLWIGEGISLLGDQFYLIALPWLVLQLAGNSLAVGTAYDVVGDGGVTALTNGNYFVGSWLWDNPAGPISNVGAVTWGSGTGITGLVTSANSLIGGTASDQVGNFGVFAVTNGSYVVGSPTWDNPVGPISNAGSVTWGNGTGGTTGLVTSATSVLGTVPSGMAYSSHSYDATRNRLFVGRGASNLVSILYTPTVMLPLVVR